MTFYDVSRDGIGLAPILLTLTWLACLAAGIAIATARPAGRRFMCVWLAAWTTMGGAGFGNVWYQHIKCTRELEAGHYRVAEGRVTSFRPQLGKADEQFTLAGITFHYNKANLGRGGLRWTGGRDGPLHVGAHARATYDADTVILRLEVR